MVDKNKKNLNLSNEIEGLEPEDQLRICMSYGHVGLSYYFNMVSEDVCYNIDTAEWYVYIGPYWEADKGHTIPGLIDVRIVDQLDVLFTIEEGIQQQIEIELSEKRELRVNSANDLKQVQKELKFSIRELEKATKSKHDDRKEFEEGQVNIRTSEVEKAEEALEQTQEEYNMTYGLLKEQRKVVRAMAKDIKSYREAAGRKNLLSVAATSVNTRRVKNEDFDADPSLLCCKNTVLKFGKSGLITQVDPSPELLLKNVMGCDYVPGARNEKWISAAYEVCGEKYGETPDDESQVKYLLRIFGAALVGQGYKLRHIPILWGPEAQSGKDTCWNEPFIELFGGYGIEHSSQLIMKESFSRSSAAADPALLSLPGKKICLMREVENGQHLSVMKLKSLTGGQRATGRQLHSSEYEDKKRITSLFSLTVNEVPVVPNSDRGSQIRMGIVHFPHSYVDFPKKEMEKKRDIDLEDKIKSDLPGILNILIEGWQDWITGERALRVPQKVRITTAEYFESIDQLAPWIEEHVLTAEEYLKKYMIEAPVRISASDVYKSYCDWFYDLTKKKGMTSNMFTRLMKSKGFDWQKIGGKPWYYGIVLDKGLED